jgi:SAM-dependent methyltransferase
VRSADIDEVERVFEYLLIPTEVREAIRDSAERLVRAANRLGKGKHADLLRVDAMHRLRLGQDIAFSGADPVSDFGDLLSRVAVFVEAGRNLPQSGGVSIARASDAVREVTAEHYGRLWGDFSPAQYFDEALGLLRQRFERNGLSPADWNGKRALDAGCGGGRYSVALRQLGFDEVIGCDWSTEAVDLARRRASQARISNVRFEQADVLDLPYNDSDFDFVFSNGVLHHTTDPLTGVRELQRVTRRDGSCWLYLYHRPGGLDRLTHYLARLVLKRSDAETCRGYCRALALAGNRVFLLLDLWLAPVAECYTPEEAVALAQQAGFRHWRRLSRGADQDLVEQTAVGAPFSDLKFGVGENRYLLWGK